MLKLEYTGTEEQKMLIKSLDKMEQIVKDNRALSWDGWDVVDRKSAPTAWRSKDGVFHKGRWYLQRIYQVTEDGWHIPKKFVR